MVQLKRNQPRTEWMSGGLTSSVVRLPQDLLRGFDRDLEIPCELPGVNILEIIQGVVACRDQSMVEEAREGEGGEGDHRWE